ncbi:hypothetical protein [Motiliproteus coralliicola]|uniref:hypothetical protein n=1 Tax=Motiliproteus coralliicola TaxID=2283196 RepID=UPI001058AEC6|nr:hypothetical protein [Motiliproteus coralliicola]
MSTIPTAIASIDEYPSVDWYWLVVEETLTEVFGRRDCDENLYQLKDEIAAINGIEQLLFFHAEPLDTASRICGEAVTDEIVHHYLQVKAQLQTVSLQQS